MKDINGKDRPCIKCKWYREHRVWCWLNCRRSEANETCSMWEEK